MSNKSDVGQFDTDGTLRLMSRLLLVVNLVWSAVLAASIFGTSGRFGRLFESFEMRISGLTTLALTRALPYTVLVLALLGLAKEWYIHNPRMNLWINVAHLFVIQIMQALYTIGAFLPLFQLLERLSNVPLYGLQNIANLC
jgi:hypothetical protein